MSRAPAFLVLLVVSGVAGCASPPEDTPIVHTGSAVCAECRMTVGDPAYAAVSRPDRGDDRVFDSIECALRFRRRHPDEEARMWLVDLDSATLHPAERMTVVHADFPSPMGGGYGAFLDPDRADEEARVRGGTVGTFDAFVTGAASTRRADP